MNIETIREYCIAKQYTTEEFPFDDTTLVFKVKGKMFLAIALDKPTKVTMKCSPTYALELRECYNGIEGAWHFNKKHWNQVSLLGDIPDPLILSLIDHSFSEVVAKLPKKEQLTFQK